MKAQIPGKLRIASLLFAVFCVLLPAENAFAAPNLTLSTSFTSVDPARADSYMDIGGTWDGSSEVFNGDIFTLTISNSTGGGETPAYDIRDIPVTVPAGFVLASNSVAVSDAGGGCPNMSASASQGGAGNPVTINIAGITAPSLIQVVVIFTRFAWKQM